MLEIISQLVHAANVESDENTLNRLLLAIGHLAFCNSECATLISVLDFAFRGNLESVRAIEKDIQSLLEY